MDGDALRRGRQRAMMFASPQREAIERLKDAPWMRECGDGQIECPTRSRGSQILYLVNDDGTDPVGFAFCDDCADEMRRM